MAISGAADRASPGSAPTARMHFAKRPGWEQQPRWKRCVQYTDESLGEALGRYYVDETFGAEGKARMLTMVKALSDRFTPALRAEAQSKGLSVQDVLTLASIVEKETGRPEERPLVAAVYENRLRIGMGLQCDPTVIYALQLAGLYNGNLRRDDLHFDSPYNTYRYAGLPPGPIASPGKASLEAAAHPADVDYIYFVSRNDGTHEFARTLADHNRNVQKFQVQYFHDKHAKH